VRDRPAGRALAQTPSPSVLSARTLSLVLLAVAIALGAAFRFADLGALEVSPDEATSWAAASAPSFAEVSTRHVELNPGEFPIYDSTLHVWIAVFGTSPFAMRAMSASFGVVSILLVYLVVNELFASALIGDELAMLAAVAALVFAANLVTIKYSREARMYPMLLAAILAQLVMFLRALRAGGATNYVAVAILTAVIIAMNYASLAVPAVEGLWLLYLLTRARWRLTDAVARGAWASMAMLAVGGLILVPRLLSLRTASHATLHGWRTLPAWYAPFALFNKATGSFAFPILAALAIWGAVAGWRRGRRDAVAFALLWMWAPPLLMFAASYAIAPVFVERYALSSFVPFFILVALGVFELPGDSIRVAGLALVLAFSIGHIVSYNRKPHDAQYREAITAAAAALKPGETMTAVPAYAIEVLRYYLPSDQQSRAVRYDTPASTAAVLILGDQNLAQGAAKSYRKEFPQMVARLRGVTVLRR
jgi:mannosyltransferase